MVARSVYLMDNIQYLSLQVDVYLSYRGRTQFTHSYTMTYPESSVEALTAESLSQVCSYINTEATDALKGVILNGSPGADGVIESLIL